MQHRLQLFAAILCGLMLSPAVAFWESLDDAAKADAQGDYAKASAVYQTFAEKGDATAQNHLGWMYQKGRGVDQDDAQAVNWYRKAAEQGIACAQSRLDRDAQTA